jgi:Zn finger protein HypA/HybF involved in hydrogenase expression
MTTLTQEQIQTLVGLIVTTEPDQITCDECLGQVGEFAEHALEGRELSDGMKIIQRHLEQCPCCQGEYEALVDALKEIEIQE